MYCNNERRFALLLVFVAWVCACATPQPVLTREAVVTQRYGQMDEFDVLLLRAGVDLTEFPVRDVWAPNQARDLVQLLRFKVSDGNHSAYGPRILAAFLLEEGLKTGKPIPRQTLVDLMHLHNQLAVLNPEGHLVSAYTGDILQCVGPLHIRNGIPQAGSFKVDAFYVPAGETFREEPSLVAPAIFTTPPAPKPPAGQTAGDGPR